MEFLTQKQFAHWSDTHASIADIAALVRDLVCATGRELTLVQFPTEKDVNSAGPDGLTDANVGTTYVPKGRTHWELSTRKQVKKKLDEDYDAKTKESTATPQQKRVTKKTTFVHVTTRDDDVGYKWAMGKSKDGIWKEVKFLRASDLITWLQFAPAVQLKFLKEAGQDVSGMSAAETYWQHRRQAMKTPITSGLMLAGYEKQIADLMALLNSERADITLQADSRNRAADTLAAMLHVSDSPEVVALRSRTVFVKDQDAWDFLSGHPQPLVLVRLNDTIQTGMHATNGHKAISLVPRMPKHAVDAVQFGYRDPEALRAEIAEIFPEPEREAQFARYLRDYDAFCRRLSRHEHANPFAGKGNMQCAAAVLVCGQFRLDSKGDLVVLSRLAGQSVDEVIAHLEAWLALECSFVHKRGDVVQVRVLADAWPYLEAHLQDRILRTMIEQAPVVLAAVDATIEMESLERLRAQMDGGGRPEYSNELKEGLARSLAILGVKNGDVNMANPTLDGTSVANQIVREVFVRSKSLEALSSLADHFPDLAEASPEAFLEGVEVIAKDEQATAGLFRDRNDFFGPSSPHTHLLWALECVAWSPEFLYRSTMLLAQLDEADPGGRLANRPLRSLSEIFCPWHPCTLATVAVRRRTLEALAKKHPNTAWRLHAELLPSAHSTAMTTYHAKERPWTEFDRPPIYTSDVREAYLDIIDRAIVLAESDCTRVEALVDCILHLDPERQAQVADLAESAFAGTVEQGQKEALIDALRGELWAERRTTNEAIRLSDLVRERFTRLLAQHEASNPYARLILLFQHTPRLPEASTDIHEMLEQVKVQQAQEVELLAPRMTIEELVEVGVAVEDLGALGVHVGRIRPDIDLAAFFEATLSIAEPKVRYFFTAVADGVRRHHPETFRRWLDEAIAGKHSLELAPILLTLLDLNAENMALFEALPLAIGKEVWKRLANLQWLSVDADVAERLAERFLSEGYTHGAVLTVGWWCRDATKVPTDLLYRSLEALASDKGLPAVAFRNLDHQIDTTLDLISKRADFDLDRLARLELIYFNLLRRQRNPEALKSVILTRPREAINLVKQFFRADDGTARPGAESHYPGEIAYFLMHEIKSVPGALAEGILDSVALQSWHREAMALAKQEQALNGYMHLLGTLFAYSPVGEDGVWPHEAVRAILDELDNARLRGTMVAEINNQRGVHARRRDAGGQQERELAAKYTVMANAVEVSSPESARILRAVADSYEHWGEREDRERDLELEM
ncbi:MAG: hypothetical protein WD716_09605 [Fimbriimonadaceae bacterium]